MAQKKVKWR